MSNKTISVNPALFSFGGTKTKKKREKKDVVKPLISPNVLRKKLLSRIKEHKLKETSKLENNKRKLLDPDRSELSNNSAIGSASITTSEELDGEFNESMAHLELLSKQKRLNDEKNIYDRQKRQRQEELERRTLKNYQALNASTPQVNIDLPDELQQRLIRVDTEQFVPSSGGANVNINQYNKDSVPYGILKGGQKPTYRDWTRTQRSDIVTNPNASLVIQGGAPNRIKLEREQRLNHLKAKLRQKQDLKELQDKPNIQVNTQVLSQRAPEIETTIPDVMLTQNLIRLSKPVTERSDQNIIRKKRIIKKTIKRKYTLGKSKIRRTVAVLIKDRGTRKMVLSAQRNLKKKDINEVKNYLREHNLIKVGSSAPNDVLRKLYESSMLAGEITNTNADNLLYNFAKED